MAATPRDFGVEVLPSGDLKVPARATAGRGVGDGKRVVRPGDEEHQRWLDFFARRGVRVDVP